MAPRAGIEPAHTGIKILCLTSLANGVIEDGKRGGTRTHNLTVLETGALPVELPECVWRKVDESNAHGFPCHRFSRPIAALRSGTFQNWRRAQGSNLRNRFRLTLA